MAETAVMVTRKEELEVVVAGIRAAGWMGLDTEFLREKTYFARLCLAQVSTAAGIYLIDPVNGLDMRPVGELLADPDIEVLVHAGWQDLQLFYQLAGSTPSHIFDIQMAAGFAGLSVSLAYGRLVEEVTGVKLEKGEAYTDWCRRPLTPQQLRYAADDVRYLAPVATRLKAELTRLGRTQWVADEMRSFELGETYEASEELWRKVAGQGTLSPRQTAVLQALVQWREEAAAGRDLPRGWLIKDATLVEAARRAPASIGELKAIRGMDAREAERSGRAILAAIERGRQAPAVERPAMPSRQIQNRARMIAGLSDALLRARAEQAELAPELLANRSDVEALLYAVLGGGNVEQQRLMQGWRRGLAGEPIVALARGECALRVIDQPPYVEEFRLRQTS